MCRRILLFILFFAIIGEIMAQEILYPSKTMNLHINDKVIYGIKGGVTIPRLYYSDKNLKDLPHDFMIGPTLSLFVEFKVYKKVSMAVELNYQQKGGATSYKYENDYDVSYKLKADYLAIRLPFYWYMSNSHTTSPYLFVGPEFAYAFGGEISLSQPGLPISDVSVAINDSNINRFNFGILGGVGIRRNIHLKNWIVVLKADAALNWGLTNTFANSETEETATPTNIHAYNSQGQRHSIGMEINLSLGFIRDKAIDDAPCHPFK
ncbi:MAG: PorT family protein [Bacteroidales bacterium]|nr:PorT family protein [Bacteroidales bacterium]